MTGRSPKILLTSGSTGRPKGVINTHGNIAASIQMVRLVSEPFDPQRVSTIVDWLPWHHAFGGNAQFNGVLSLAGTLYIDTGRPVPGLFDATIENLREISPTSFGCVPAAFGMLAAALEKDAELRQKFFKNMRALGYGGALLPQPIWERMQRVAVQEIGEQLPFGTGWGMTETTATGVAVYWTTARTGLLGLPQPGAALKLVPNGDRWELRIKGPHIMSGYYRADALNAAAFDTEGYFKTGDAVRWVDPARPLEGLEFAGRLAEDFKLLSGTWVQASIVRRDLVEALQPFVSDAVICAPDHAWLGALVWLALPDDARLRSGLAQKLAAFNHARQGSADTIAKLLILKDPPVGGSGRDHRQAFHQSEIGDGAPRERSGAAVRGSDGTPHSRAGRHQAERYECARSLLRRGAEHRQNHRRRVALIEVDGIRRHARRRRRRHAERFAGIRIDFELGGIR